MPGVKLRSEKLDQYDALGERGQPVYQAASQILSALKRRRPDLADHFAVPQSSADGRLIDWYAPLPGPVVAWSAATEGERAAALVRLAEVRQEVEALRTGLSDGSGSLFAQLLKWIMHHPDSTHVYLVNGNPVMTFWGFLNAGADRHLAPLHALNTAPRTVVPVPDQASLPSAPARVLEPAAMPRPWWRRWWWLLPLLLLLALILLGLRACAPGLPLAVGLPGATPPAVPAVKVPAPASQSLDVGLPVIPVGGVSAAAGPPVGVGTSAFVPTLAGPGVGAMPDSGPALASAAVPVAAGAAQAERPAGTPAALPAPSIPGTAPAVPALPPGESLIMPPQLADGAADFLNGDWRVRAGIQDRNTGEPLRLQYQFEKGEGTVTVNRHNGVSCQAPVSATVATGALLINNGSAASCSDGSTYAMPTIRCQAGATQIAACTGNYGSELFPLTMRKP